MARDAAAGGGGGEMVAERRPSFVQDCKEAGFVNACERQWHRTVAHAKAFPYLWASYFLIYGGFGTYFVYQRRRLHQAENQVLRLQKELLNKVQQQEEQEAIIKAMKQNQQTTAAPSPQLQPNSSSVSL
ncbi:unnamed protein product [Sphagnum compactum]